jgi:hexosaminidase
MKKILCLLGSCLLMLASFAQAPIALIPQPVSLQQKEGVFMLPQAVVIEAPQHPELKTTLSFLQARLGTPTGRKVSVYR